jgi:prepilin-type N-terminal cleavage/methylation domain-containing protein
MFTAFKAQRAFTLVEVLFAVAAFALLSIVLFTFLEMGLRISAKTLSVSLTEWQARRALATIMNEIQLASGPPTFIDHNGNDLPNTARAGLGLRYQTWSETDYNSRGSAAIIVVNGNELRHYPSGFVATRLGGDYRVLSRNMVAPATFSGTLPRQHYPFHVTSYPAADERAAGRLIDVNLKVMARDYNRFLAGRRQGGIGELQGPNTFLQIRGLVGYRFNDTVLQIP